jgi:mono/diheme cytochrome c family protein
MRRKTILLLIVGSALLELAASAQAPTRGEALFVELGCAACHVNRILSSPWRERTPDLSSAGLRYNPGYLFDFLQRPSKVRRHLGVARMPDFYLSENEAVALVAFLETQRAITGEWPVVPPTASAQPRNELKPGSAERLRSELSNGLICLTCHKVGGQGGELGIELTTVSYRLRPEWVREYLVAPARFGVPPSTMPPQFFQLARDGKSFHETMPHAAEHVGRVTDALFSLNAARREALEKTYASAQAAYPRSDAALGEQLFRSLNCAVCHRHHAISPRAEPGAPELGGEGVRVKKTWLESFLKHPQPIRPFGYRPGDGSRMPDFRLSDDEVAALSAVLSAPPRSGQPLPTNYQPHALSAFAQQKARLLLTEKLSCLGCHQLGGQGGRIGPDLTAASARLQPDYVYGMITNPRAVAPHSVMPQVPMSEETARLLADYLLQQPAVPSNAKYLSATDHALISWDTSAAAASGISEVRRTYLIYCAACHGNDGRGDGYNARYLPVRPTAHADAKYLTTRPDDTLYDGVHSGGYILNKSRLMPAWGQTLSPKQIRELVGHLRTLCQCQGPAWSRDNAQLP